MMRSEKLRLRRNKLSLHFDLGGTCGDGVYTGVADIYHYALRGAAEFAISLDARNRKAARNQRHRRFNVNPMQTIGLPGNHYYSVWCRCVNMSDVLHVFDFIIVFVKLVRPVSYPLPFHFPPCAPTAFCFTGSGTSEL